MGAADGIKILQFYMEAGMSAGKFLRNAWYVCAWDKEVGRELLSRTICGEPVVVFRLESGTPVVLEDRCCHRHLPLSKGRLIGDTLQCGYHGLEFDGSGNCIRVPGQTRVPPGARVRGYPTVERHRFVWMWPGDPAKADPAKIPDMSWNDMPGWASVGSVLRIECDYRLLVDNLLDLTHETYVHVGSIGHEAIVHHPIKTARDGDTVTVTRWIMDHDPAPFWKAAIGRPGNCDRWQIIRYSPPANIDLDLGVALTGTGAPSGDRSQGVNGHNLDLITPETERSCFQFWAFARNFRIDDRALDQKLLETVVKIFNEDKVLLEAQQRSLEAAPPGYQWIDVNADAGSIQARRVLQAALDSEAADGARVAAE
jgi:vanillate O-demethylase monooxygenase subunit